MNNICLTQLATAVETTSTFSIKSSLRNQVARSKGNQWMVSSYNAWQRRSPLDSMPQRNPSSILRIVSRIDHKENPLNSVSAR